MSDSTRLLRHFLDFPTWKFPHIWNSIHRCLCKSRSTCLGKGDLRSRISSAWELQLCLPHPPPAQPEQGDLHLPGEALPIHMKVRKISFSPPLTLAGCLGPRSLGHDLYWRVSREMISGDATRLGHNRTRVLQFHLSWSCRPCCKKAAPQPMWPLSSPPSCYLLCLWSLSDTEQSLLVYNSTPMYLSSFHVMW